MTEKTTTIKKDHTPQGLEPQLRFKMDNGEDFPSWELLPLGDIATLVKSKNKNEEFSRVLTNSAAEGILDQRDYFDKDIANKNNLQGYYIVEEGDYVYNPRVSNLAPVGPISKNDLGKGVMSPLYTVFRFNNKENSFYKYFFQSSKWYQYLRSVSNTGARHDRMNVSVADFLKMPLPAPIQGEQQKIADCLSSLDAHIQAQSEKLDGLRQHKKGMLQQLFPAEGKTLPQKRFPEFENEGEWLLEPMGDIYSFKITNSFSRDKLNYEEGKVKNIHYGDIHTQFSTLFDITEETVPFINSDVSLERINQENYCLEGDLVFADASEDMADIGKCIEIVKLNNERLLSGLHTFLARQIESKLVAGFGGYLFKSTSIRDQIKREAQGTKVLGISKNRLANIKIYYPKSQKEQQKIADCLSALDAHIQAQSEKLDALKAHKKGLLQQLFPTLEPVSL